MSCLCGRVICGQGRTEQKVTVLINDRVGIETGPDFIMTHNKSGGGSFDLGFNFSRLMDLTTVEVNNFILFNIEDDDRSGILFRIIFSIISCWNFISLMLYGR